METKIMAILERNRRDVEDGALRWRRGVAWRGVAVPLRREVGAGGEGVASRSNRRKAQADAFEICTMPSRSGFQCNFTVAPPALDF